MGDTVKEQSRLPGTPEGRELCPFTVLRLTGQGGERIHTRPMKTYGVREVHILPITGLTGDP